MKKIISLTLALAMVLTLAVGCSKKPVETQPETTLPAPETTAPVIEETEAPETEAPVIEDDNTMKALIAEIYAAHAPLELMLDTLPNEYFPLESIMESITYYTGLSDGSKISEIAISEPMMGQAYSLVAIKVANADDAAAVAQEMYDNIDQRKWICVEADDLQVVSYADVVMLIMVGSDTGMTSQSFVDAFAEVCGGNVTAH